MSRLQVTVCAWLLIAFFVRASAAATRVELVVDEARENRTVAWPVTTGIPFARGQLADAELCRLLDDLGREQPLQAKVAAVWDVQRSSIRWLTIDFIAQPGRKYALEFGPDVRRRPAPKRLRIEETDEEISAATGPLQLEFSRTGSAALKSVRIDVNGDGKITPEEMIASGDATGDRQYVDASGRVASSALDRTDRSIVIESSGPVRACVRIDGGYVGPDGGQIVTYRTRYHLYAGLAAIKVVDEFCIVGSTRNVKFRDITWPLRLHLGDGPVSAAAHLGADSPQSFALKEPQAAVSLRQETYRHYGNLECRAVWESHPAARPAATAERAGPWLQVAGPRGTATGSLRWFRQQFPKEWTASADRLTLHLWSPHVAPLDFGEEGLRAFFGPAGNRYLLDWQGTRKPQTPIENFFYFAGRHALERDGADGRGLNKHHEAWYHFGRHDDAAAGREYGELADCPPLCLATGAWNVGTDVFGPLAARPNDSPCEAIVDRIFDLERYAQDHFGDYGWWLFGAGPHYSYQWDSTEKRHYADPRRFEYHTYQRETQLWWNYFRSGERKFYDWAIPSENHWVDVAVSHVPTTYSTQWRGGKRQDATLHYVAGDWSIDSPLHYVRHHDTGEAWLRSAPQLWATYHRTLETTTLAHYLTGDQRYDDVIEFWRSYWGGLAGVRSNSTDVPIWYREQLWWRPTKDGEPTRTWAEMLRDYAPFQSGSRHQLTLLFNLATLYEHTWDERVGTALREYADAFLDPDAPNGVWQCQDHRLPANADSPMLAHYWAPALWKYARATNDPRLPAVLQKYFRACLEADPYGEDVGIYSNNQIAWAWYFTKDPRHWVAARRELASLLPHAAPLERPEDLGRRIYNPYAPIKTLAAVPRLIGILEEARRLNVEVPSEPPLSPQRTWIAVKQESGTELRGVLWGWDARPQWFDALGRPSVARIETSVHRSHLRPFDRVLPGYQVFRHGFRLAAGDDDGWRFLRPRLETGLIELAGSSSPIWCWAGDPIRVEPTSPWHWRRADGGDELSLETARPALLSVQHRGRALAGRIVKNRLTVNLAEVPANDSVKISITGEREAWFRIVERPSAQAWVCPHDPRHELAPSAPPIVNATTEDLLADASYTSVPGRFGQALRMLPGRELRIPNEAAAPTGGVQPLCDVRQGTIEFWIRRQWDERLTPISTAPLLSAGGVYVPLPNDLPLDEWAHVAVVWHPMPDDESLRSLVHVYVNGVDYGNYRSIAWQGYSQPPTFSPQSESAKQFVLRCGPEMSYWIDDLRVSGRPRYLDVSLEFGRTQTYNPKSFPVPQTPASGDDATTLRMTFDRDLRATAFADTVTLEAELTDK